MINQEAIDFDKAIGEELKDLGQNPRGSVAWRPPDEEFKEGAYLTTATFYVGSDRKEYFMLFAKGTWDLITPAVAASFLAQYIKGDNDDR